MSLHPYTLLAIAGMAIATYLTRIAGLRLVRFVNVEGRAKAALDAMPPAILMAVVAPVAFATGPAETIAALITAVVAFRLPLVAAVVVGVVAVVALRAVLG
ncbi:MAG: AzlD domain-containing protein [Hyphomicrobiales bacterium]